MPNPCKNCGGTEFDEDPSRGDVVCVSCGVVSESVVVSSETQFQEDSHGRCNAVGQFLSSQSKGLGSTESRQLTIWKAKQGISIICNQLKLTTMYIDIAVNFYKMALDKNLTRGRKNVLVQAACIYLTCRIENLPYMLIDISDVVQICCFELGKAYVCLSEALCITLPMIDPGLYVMRYANKLYFEDKTRDVVDTAIRIVDRMKKDSIHSGRRPAGLCGAALLMAARFHEFNRTIEDIIKVVRVHESTIKKRLLEFSDTPASALTLHEFTTVDLEEEHDPPSFKAARKKEELNKLIEELFTSKQEKLTTLQKEIESQLNLTIGKRKRTSMTSAPEKVINDEATDQSNFIDASTRDTIQEILKEQNIDDPDCSNKIIEFELGPNLQTMGLASSLSDEVDLPRTVETNDEENLDDIDDKELDAYILDDKEAEMKKLLWTQLHADYLEEQKIRKELLQMEEETNEAPKKKRRKYTKKTKSSAQSASAEKEIQKMLEEKKFASKKINHEIFGKLKFSKVSPINDKPSSEPPKAELQSSLRATRQRRNVCPQILKNIRISKPTPNLPSIVRSSLPLVVDTSPKTVSATILSEIINTTETQVTEPEDSALLEEEEDDDNCDEEDFYDDDEDAIDAYDEDEEYGVESYD